MDLKHSLRKKIFAERYLFDADKFCAENKLIVENTNLIINTIYNNLSDKDKTFTHVGIGSSNMASSKNSIGLYWPFKGEPNLIKLLDNNGTFCLPRINNNQLEFAHYHKGVKLEKGIKGIKHSSSDAILIPSIIIAPGLAYCQKGYRLGFGSGYYDKYFSRYAINTSIIKIGVCFDKYLLESLPIEKHDTKFNYVITDRTILKL